MDGWQIAERLLLIVVGGGSGAAVLKVLQLFLRERRSDQHSLVEQYKSGRDDADIKAGIAYGKLNELFNKLDEERDVDRKNYAKLVVRDIENAAIIKRLRTENVELRKELSSDKRGRIPSTDRRGRQDDGAADEESA